MGFLEPQDMTSREPLPGWKGRFWHSESMSFASYAIDAGSSIHEHHHPHEEVWIVIEGELDVTIGGVTQSVGPGCVAVVSADVPHSVRANTRAAAIVANHPVRHMFR